MHYRAWRQAGNKQLEFLNRLTSARPHLEFLKRLAGPRPDMDREPSPTHGARERFVISPLLADKIVGRAFAAEVSGDAPSIIGARQRRPPGYATGQSKCDRE